MFDIINNLPYIGSRDETENSDELSESLLNSEEIAGDVNVETPRENPEAYGLDKEELYVENDEISHYFLREIHKGADFPGEDAEALLSRTRHFAEEKDVELSESHIDRVLEAYSNEPEYVKAAIENEDESHKSRIDEAHPDFPDADDLGNRRPK